jgi:hypothetical protein
MEAVSHTIHATVRDFVNAVIKSSSNAQFYTFVALLEIKKSEKNYFAENSF